MSANKEKKNNENDSTTWYKKVDTIFQATVHKRWQIPNHEKKTQQRNVKPIKQKEQTNERKKERMNYAKLHWGDLHTLLFEIITVALFDADNITALHSTKWIIDSILLLWLALICVEKKLSGDSLRKGKAQ